MPAPPDGDAEPAHVPPSPGEWVNRGEQTIYSSRWVELVTADVVLPDGTRLDHHVVRMPAAAAGCVVTSDDGVLLLYRHRFITDTWGWEIPAGRIEADESPAEAVRRETLEETGWEPGSVTPLCRFHPSNGLSDQTFHIFSATDVTHRGDPSDANEAVRVQWHSPEQVRRLLVEGAITDGLSFSALNHAFVAGLI